MKKIILLATIVAMTMPIMAQNAKIYLMDGRSMDCSFISFTNTEATLTLNNNEVTIYADKIDRIEPYTGYIVANWNGQLVKTSRMKIKDREIFNNSSKDSINIQNRPTNHLISIQIPPYFNLKDKIFICNQSPYSILRAVVVYGDDYNRVIGTCNFLSPQDCVKIADFPANGLSALRGQTICVKVKGLKNNQITDFTDYSEDTTQSEQVTYDFNISIKEQQHDLYINVSGGEEIGNDPLDF